jgi:thiosulfate/3-mercaptopyruvate sulfurtransferase
MGGCVSRSIGLKKLRSAALLFGLIGSFSLSILAFTAMAGTETGEFCPTCPDWTNLEGWLAQKDAYEMAQMNGQNGQQGSQATSQPEAIVAAKEEAKATESYVRPDLITMPENLDGEGIILDVRSEDDYLAGHISGARNIYWRNLQEDGILDQSRLVEALGWAGIEESQRITICGSPDDEGGPFLFWALSYIGHENISLLDGGIAAARVAGTALSNNAPSIQTTNYSARIRPWLLVTPANLGGMLSQSDLRIFDARDFSDYGQSRLGNESINSFPLSLDKIYDGSSRIKSPGTLKNLFERRIDPEDTVIVYGTPQAYSLFYSLRLMGCNATLIQGDWWKETEWSVRNIG